MSWNRREKHEQEHCTNRLLVCVDCKEEIRGYHYQKHLKESCRERLLRCKVGKLKSK